MALMVPDLQLVITNSRLGTMKVAELFDQLQKELPSVALLHIDPAPAHQEPPADVPTLHQPFTRDQLLTAVGEILA
jgi:hypothetical protein